MHGTVSAIRSCHDPGVETGLRGPAREEGIVMADKRISPKPPVDRKTLDQNGAADVTKTSAKKLGHKKLGHKKLGH
jgi:hypothetical protein